MKRVLVSSILDNGDEIDVSVRVDNGDLTLEHKNKLKRDVARKLLCNAEDTLYFKVRYNEKVGKSKGITDSLKVSTVVELSNAIDEIFAKIGVDNG